MRAVGKYCIEVSGWYQINQETRTGCIDEVDKVNCAGCYDEFLRRVSSPNSRPQFAEYNWVGSVQYVVVCSALISEIALRRIQVALQLSAGTQV